MVKLLRPWADSGQDRRVALRRTLAGMAAALATMAVLTAAMLPLPPRDREFRPFASRPGLLPL